LREDAKEKLGLRREKARKQGEKIRKRSNHRSC